MSSRQRRGGGSATSGSGPLQPRRNVRAKLALAHLEVEKLLRKACQDLVAAGLDAVQGRDRVLREVACLADIALETRQLLLEGGVLHGLHDVTGCGKKFKISCSMFENESPLAQSR